MREKRQLDENLWENQRNSITTYYTGSIRGRALNNIFTVGSGGECLHFNGLMWHTYRALGGFNGNYYAVAAGRNKVIAVGDFVTVAIGSRMDESPGPTARNGRTGSLRITTAASRNGGRCFIADILFRASTEPLESRCILS